MTILTPTSNPVNPPNPPASPSAALPGAPSVPPGLPDPAVLARLAGAFFSALPGTSPAAAQSLPVVNNPAPPGSPVAGPGGTGTGVPGAAIPQGHVPGANLLPAAPTHVLSLANRAPALRPTSVAQNGLPDTVATVAPAVESRFGGQALGVPHAPSPSPQSSAAPAYYFLEGAGRDLHGGASSLREIATFGDPLSLHLPQQGQGACGSGREQEQTLPWASSSARVPFDVNAIRRDFPILQERVNGRQLVWFDNAATTHKPQSVIDRIAYFYAHENSNIHRAAHALAGRATDAYEAARSKVRRFIGASSPDEIIFVRGTTEAINLIAKTWGVQNVGEGDEIIVSHLEHHANIVPWQQLAAQTGARLRVIPVDDSGQVLLDEYRRLLNDRTRIVSVTQVSNALGTVVPVKEIVDLAHRAGARALVDGAQSVSHMRVDVQAIDADFFVFSGHKVFGPTGIGVVYGKRELLEAMPPWQGGGNMIADVTFERTVFQPPPNRFEAGTGNIADAVGLGAALDYVERVGIENIARYEHELLEYATHLLQPIPGVRLVGTARDKASVLSFVLKGYETEEVGRALNEEGIAVRSGHHCAQPILRRFGVEATVRPSLAFYNTTDEVDRLISVVRRLSGRR
ncbi:family 2A encapsulin nanocompartment cargo protein cysteine desulfurase [Cupriavidus sp. UME77]|uniref:family 2A encapsulin nanocompartment cargo protein cysteine desulfurase n=1 Tax=Cupriavidus sp. UME77 TaxID=1862321 RepID=UPI0015FFF952|nr:family 2A encapsulin nanocompartment cargo protein cysteine desulfurase [Cupriavidus sp. UME77]MBB1631611.1 cysteine desulfurase [Cupriavidus sp. UME77]